MAHAVSIEEHTRRHRQRLAIIRSGKLACWRCGGGGQYHVHGTCFRCGGSGVDPEQPKHPEKSKRIKAAQAWAAQFDHRGEPVTP